MTGKKEANSLKELSQKYGKDFSLTMDAETINMAEPSMQALEYAKEDAEFTMKAYELFKEKEEVETIKNTRWNKILRFFRRLFK